MTYPCPCCEYLTFDKKPDGSFEICPVCFWEDDNIQNKDVDYEGGANDISLRQAKENFLQYGAIKKEFISNVRKALPEELKE